MPAKTHSQIKSAVTSLSHPQGKEDTLSESSKSPIGLVETGDIPKTTNNLIGKCINGSIHSIGYMHYFMMTIHMDHTRSVVFTCLTSPVENW